MDLLLGGVTELIMLSVSKDLMSVSATAKISNSQDLIRGIRGPLLWTDLQFSTAKLVGLGLEATSSQNNRSSKRFLKFLFMGDMSCIVEIAIFSN